ncbi:DUF982 domain-containing protein [Rhizobium laguerreae]|uniref:DUF982 domain-containing protein n=1 Tax=Rhizobium laguerreae TaxID=1076926 RepID=UPI001FEC1E4C|nr:DUF982 domain-containing protein [Rhizobium laguerreae]
MQTEIWQTPIELAIEGGDHFKCVQNSRDALETLMTCWPVKGGNLSECGQRGRRPSPLG